LEKLLDVVTENDTLKITLNRPEVHNAFNDDMIAELTAVFEDIAVDADRARVVVLSGKGKSFCAGADLNWMKKARGYSLEENYADSKRLAEMFKVINGCPLPVIGRINGHAFGGGVGLVATCDLSVAFEKAKFAFSEVKLGIIPAVISPYVVPKMGITRSRDLFITGRRFTAREALEYGFVTHVAGSMEELDQIVDTLIKEIKSAAPIACREAKKLVMKYNGFMNVEMEEFTSRKIAELRSSPEGREGISSFLDKRTPEWRKQD